MLPCHEPVVPVEATAPQSGATFPERLALCSGVRPAGPAHEQRGAVVCTPDLPPDPQLVVVDAAAGNDL